MVQLVDECAKCLRKSTKSYPLSFSTIPMDNIRRTKFGFPVSDGDTICHCCLEYVHRRGEKEVVSLLACSVIHHDS